MPPDYPYSIHLNHPDSTYNFDSYSAVRIFLDTTRLFSDTKKAELLQAMKVSQADIEREKTAKANGDIISAGTIVEIALIVGLLIIYLLNKCSAKRLNPAQDNGMNIGLPSHFVYKGSELDFDSVSLEIICLKYSSFFRTLEKIEQAAFLVRVQDFMHRKQFRMYGEDCYREMPVLLSATAVQLCFGLPGFYLDSYPIISIRPQAYLGYEPLRILTGNVQGNTITVSWEHFLKDNFDAADGNNVGLHEMAHALAMQLLYAPGKHQQAAGLLRSFYEQLETFTATEKAGSSPLFDVYSLQNVDECWAKCIELFFERGDEMQYYYPELYGGVKGILNQ